MRRSSLILVLALASLALFFVWKESESGVAMLVSIILLGIALAQLYWTDFVSATRKTRYLSRYSFSLLALCCLADFILLGAVDTALKPPTVALGHRGRAAADTLEWVLALIGLIVPVWPLLLRGIRNHDARGIQAPLWPIIAGLGGGGALWLAGGFIWMALAEPALTAPLPIDDVALFSMLVLAEAGLVAGVGGTIWWRALDQHAAARFNRAGIFAGAVATTVSSLGLGAVIVLSVTVRNLSSIVSPGDSGKAWCGLLLALLGTAWIIALLRVRNLEPAKSIAAIGVVALLMILFVVGFAIPSILVDAREWASFALLLVVPLTIVAAIFVLIVIPRVIRVALA